MVPSLFPLQAAIASGGGFMRPSDCFGGRSVSSACAAGIPPVNSRRINVIPITKLFILSAPFLFYTSHIAGKCDTKME